MQVILMRGLSGAGKSKWVREYAPLNLVVSADHYQVDPDGVYRYRRDRTNEAHKKCFLDFVKLVVNELVIDAKIQPLALVVDNTNTTVLELAPYYRLADAYGHDVRIVEIKADPQTCAERNAHGTPAITIGMMYRNLQTEQLPRWWKRETYENYDHGFVLRTSLQTG